ncbi:MAG TPA: glutamate racemase [Candidatus Baltobacteraceae bacterium]|jgi:glutamate racemase|nr:glutamate racemase [Candidatus Baltobacteraceae bacterium]
MIGLFDSGLGGLTVVRRVHERLPQADLLFFADQAHVPYGDRTPDDLHRLLSANLAWLDRQGAATIVIGCNTSCAIAERYGWPSTRAHVLDLIDSAATAVQRAGYRRVGVVATAATVRAGSYGRTLRSAVAGAEVWEVAAPALVPLVEAGEIGTPRAHEAVAAVCAQLPCDLDAVIYGCTHYPLLEEHFRNSLGENVALVDPAVMQAERAAHLAEGTQAESGRVRYVTSGDLGRFHENVARIMNESDPDTDTAAPAGLNGSTGMIPSHAWP